MEKLSFALLISARRLRPYFQAHPIVVITDQPLRSVLTKPDHSGRLLKWAVELSEFDLQYIPRTAIKGQVIADFLVDFAEGIAPDPSVPAESPWVLFIDGSSKPGHAGLGIVLIDPSGNRTYQSFALAFVATNNQTEYEALIAGLQLAHNLGVKHILVKTDSQLIAGQVDGQFEAKEETMQKYLARVKLLTGKFVHFSIEHIPRNDNQIADLLSKQQVVSENETIILQTPAIQETEAFAIDIKHMGSWLEPYVQYLSTGTIPDYVSDKRRFRHKAAQFHLHDDQLYKKSVTSLFLKCVKESDVPTILTEIHSGECGSHSGGKTLAHRTLRQGYYWPMIHADADQFAKHCEKCQKFAPRLHQPANPLQSILSPWPFAYWGLDIVGPFPPSSGQRKFIIVGIDYFSKWIEARAVARITAATVQNFVQTDIICRYGLPVALITDNGTQFADKGFRQFCKDQNIELRFTSVHHPKANGQAEAANKVILNLLKKKIEGSKGTWADLLPTVLWALRTTPSSATGQTPFSLSHGVEAVLPIEHYVPSYRITTASATTNTGDWLTQNSEALQVALDTIEEKRTMASLRQAHIKQRTAQYYNRHVKPRTFRAGDLVLKKVDAAARGLPIGKLEPTWNGPFIICKQVAPGAYKLKTFLGHDVPRTWNCEDLKLFFP